MNISEVNLCVLLSSRNNKTRALTQFATLMMSRLIQGRASDFIQINKKKKKYMEAPKCESIPPFLKVGEFELA